MTITTKRRARRIAADEAHAWARNLRLGNHHAKSVLRSLTLYVDGDGFCYVGIDQLADDCELSPDTVRRRLVWLEEVGAIVRVPQWIDAKGVRNSDARGKRTTDLIRLQVDADQDMIEALARGETVAENQAETTAFSPSSQLGLNSGQGSVSPAPALRQPSHCGEGLISEPEPELESPLSPQGGVSEREAGQAEPEDFGPAWSSWRGHEVMRRDLALAEFRQLTPDKQRHCRSAIPMFFKLQDQMGRKHPPNFHLWIRTRGFEEFAASSIESQILATNYAADSVEGRAIKALYRFARTSLFENRGFVVYPLPVTARVLAFASMPPAPEWHWIEESNEIAAWSAFLSSHIHRPRAELVTKRSLSADERRGMYAPWPWPPRKDGTIAEEKTGDES